MKYEVRINSFYIDWFKNYQLHRLYGPAIESSYKRWYKDGLTHRLWFIDGVEYNEEEFNKVIQ